MTASQHESSSQANEKEQLEHPWPPRIYDEEGNLLVQADEMPERVILLPAGDPHYAKPEADRIRIQWGHHLLADLAARRYRTFVCGVNAEDNMHGIITQLAGILPASQWNNERITSYAKMFASSISGDEVLVLKYDMDWVEVLALLRPPGRDHFKLRDLQFGFRIVSEMIGNRAERLPCASVSFLSAKTNALRDPDHEEPSFEAVLRTMFEAGYRGDVYPSFGMWEIAPTGLFASFPFPESLDRMRAGGF